MGLDQYAYSAARAGQYDDYYEQGQFDPVQKEFVSPATQHKELAYWRKHPNLQGWMEQLWQDRRAGQPASPDGFNGVELELTWEDLDQLEADIRAGLMAQLNTTGFFFGNASDDYYHEQDLEFVRQARAELFLGLRVFYNSSW
jgi:hypothetical protein